MNNKAILGMIVIAATMSFSSAMAAGAAKANLVEYSKQVKEAYSTGLTTGKGSPVQRKERMQDQMINTLKLDAQTAVNLKVAINNSSKSAERMDNLLTIIAANRMAKEVSKTDPVEGKSLEDGAAAAAKLLSCSPLFGDGRPAKTLNASEMKEVTESLAKLETLAGPILTQFSKAERESYTKILEQFDASIRQGGTSKTAEEVFVQAVMDAKNIDRTKALELIKKLKECV